MSIITLTTDYGNKDYFVSSLKAKIVSEIDTAESCAGKVFSYLKTKKFIH